MAYLGDFKLGQTIPAKFTTVTPATQVATTLSGSPVVSAYPNNSTTQLTAGITLTVDFDTVVGYNDLAIVATAGNGYAAATDYTLTITTGTVGGTSAVGYCVHTFSIENRVVNVASLPVLTGAYPGIGIIDSGTAQSATGTTLVLRAAAAFADSSVNGMTLLAFGSTQGYWQSRQIDSYVGSTDTATVPAWSVTPSGTITYILMGTAPLSATNAISANVVSISGDTAAADNLEAMLDGTGGVSLTTNVVGNLTGNVGGAVAGSVASVTAAVTAAPASIASIITGILNGTLTQSYAADGAEPTLAQAVYAIQQFLQGKSVAGTVLTVYALNGTTPVMVFALDDADNPTSITRVA